MKALYITFSWEKKNAPLLDTVHFIREDIYVGQHENALAIISHLLPDTYGGQSRLNAFTYMISQWRIL